MEILFGVLKMKCGAALSVLHSVGRNVDLLDKNVGMLSCTADRKVLLTRLRRTSLVTVTGERETFVSSKLKLGLVTRKPTGA